MLKRCGRCKTKKPIQDFYKNRQKKDGRQSKCKVCQKKYHNRNWYKKNKKRIIEKNYTRKAKVKRANFKKVLELYFSKGCVDCGTQNPRVLEFDHVTGIKRSIKHQRGAGVGYLVRNGYKWSTIKREIDKCVVRCRNCHHIKTFKDFKYHTDVQDIIKEYEENLELYNKDERYRCII